MANKLYEETHIQDIADAIREKNGTENTYKVSEMGDAVRGLEISVSETFTFPFRRSNDITVHCKDVMMGEFSESVNVVNGEIGILSETVRVMQKYINPCFQIESGTELTAVVDCNVGDLVVAAIATRDTLELSDGWTLISTSGINSNDTTNGHRLSFAYKYAESTEESITVTQASAQRLYINMVALQGATGFVDNGYNYVDEAVSSITINKPDGLVLFACTCPVWITSLPYPLWTYSNNSKLIQLGEYTQSRLVVALDESSDSEVTFTSGATSTMIAGSLTIQGMDSFLNK